MDRMIASPLTTTFGGTCCRPSALRNKLNTTTIFVNEVTITATNGASASPTTVTRMSAGLKLEKSIGIDRMHLHAQHIIHRDQLSGADPDAVGPDDHPRLLQTAGQLEDITGLEPCQRSEGDREAPHLEVERYRNACQRAARSLGTGVGLLHSL